MKARTSLPAGFWTLARQRRRDGARLRRRLLSPLPDPLEEPDLVTGSNPMRKRYSSGHENPVCLGNDMQAPTAGRPIRLSVLSSAQAGVVAVLAFALVVYLHEPTIVNDESPSWSSPGGHQGGIRAVAFSPEGRRLATGGDDGSVLVREVGRGGAHELGGTTPVSCLAFSPDGATLAAGYHDSHSCDLGRGHREQANDV